MILNRPNGSVISPNSVTFFADYVKVVEDNTDTFCSRPKNVVFNDISFMAILTGDHPQR